MVDLINDVFKPVYERVLRKKEDLKGKQKKPTHGFECWLMIQLFFALENTNLKPECHDKGPDITFSDGTELELKAAADFNLKWLIEEGALHHKAPVLFLFNGKDANNIKISELKNRPEVTLLCYNHFSVRKERWILGLIEPIQFYIDKYHEGKMKKKKRKTKKIPQKNYPPQLRKRGTYQDFEDLKDHLENAPDSKITMCMDKALIEGRTYDQLLEEMAKNNKRLGNKEFLNISRIDRHIKWRKKNDGWVFKCLGEPKESNTFVRLVDLRLVKSK